MASLYFEQFVKDNNLYGKEDEIIVNSLISHLVNQAATRVLIYDFP
jgi:hypothetical protein